MSYNQIHMNKASGIYSFIADSVEDIKLLPSWCAMGSSCYIINESREYIKNGKRQWVQMQSTTSSDSQGQTNPSGGKASYVVVNSLPNTGETGTIYYVPNNQDEDNNLYDEYTYVNGNWEKLGTVDNSDLIPISNDSIDRYFENS